MEVALFIFFVVAVIYMLVRLSRVTRLLEITKTGLEGQLNVLRRNNRDLSRRIENLERRAYTTERTTADSAPIEQPKPADSTVAPEPVTIAEPVQVEPETPEPVPIVPPPKITQPIEVPEDRPEPKPVAKTPSKPGFELDWESWLGIRGAAVLGGVVLVLATVYLFRYSIEKGWITPGLRVISGLTGGIGAIIGAEALRRRDFPWPAAGLAGAGIAALYVSLWAAHFLYGFLDTRVCFALMGLVTLGCGWLSLYQRSILVAALGLAGGFAAPVMVTFSDFSTTELFLYLVLLNCGVLFLTRRLKHPALAAMGLAATFLFQFSHLVQGNIEQNLLNTLMMVGFAPLYSWPRDDGNRKNFWKNLRRSAWLPPFLLLGGMITAQGDNLDWVRPAVVLCALTPAAIYMSRRHRDQVIVLITAVLTLFLLGMTFNSWTELTASPWLTMSLLCGPALITGVASLAMPRYEDVPNLVAPSLTLVAGTMILALAASAVADFLEIGPLLATWFVLAAILTLHARKADCYLGYLAASTGPSAGIMILMVSPLIGEALSQLQGMGLACLALAAAGYPLFFAHKAGEEKERDRALLATRVAALLAIWFFWFTFLNQALSALMTTVTIILAMGAVAMSGGRGYARTVAVAFAAQTIFALTGTEDARVLLLHFISVALLTLYPAIPGCRMEQGWWRRAAAAGAAPAWLLGLWVSWDAVLPDVSAVYLALALAALPILAYRLVAEASEAMRNAWITAGAALLAQVIPFGLGWEMFAAESGWWIVQGFMLAVILGLYGQRTGNLTVQIAALVFGIPAVLVRFADGIFDAPGGYAALTDHLLDPTWLVPLAFCFAGYRLSLRTGEGGGRISAVFGLFGLITGFVWMNRTISYLFAPDTVLVSEEYHELAGDLIRSLSWIGFALIIMAHGIRHGRSGPRKLGLAFLMLAISKVFIYDLSQLTDLWRVASLFGLALSLILVSVAYRRFVKPSGLETR
ncbi:MAG: DUF2339 domain-containing protein [Acidobacteriota bacterium]|nr:DUF2339 domain-containing protein [Acidobacteriota bacterium]